MSAIIALGPFVGGGLRCWDEDTGKGSAKDLLEEQGVDCRIAKRLHIFNAKCAHETLPFNGKRTTVTWFCSEGAACVNDDVRAEAEELGFRLPKAGQNSIAVRAPLGYWQQLNECERDAVMTAAGHADVFRRSCLQRKMATLQ